MRLKSTISVLIVDDEPLARHGLQEILTEDKSIMILGEAKDGDEALEKILQFSPDVVFMDIQMPERNGFEVLRSIPKEKLPITIFVTAFDEFALKAFSENALDYILKPFDDERIHASVQRAKELISLKERAAYSSRMVHMMESMGGREKFTQRISIRTSKKIIFINVNDILWIESDADYIHIHTAKEKHVTRETMKGIEPQLDPSKFVRIHRSFIVNIDHILELQPLHHGDYVAQLKNGQRLSVSRKYKAKLSVLLH